MSNEIKAEPVVLRAPTSTGSHYEEVRLPLTEQELARERLRAKVDVLTETVSLKAQLQREPIKMLGGASAVGAVLGLALGSQIRRTKTVYVDANSPIKYQRGLIKAQQQESGSNLGGALFATLLAAGTRALGNQLVQDRLQAVAEDLLSKAGETSGGKVTGRASTTPARSQGAGTPARQPSALPPRAAANPAVNRFLKPEQAASVRTDTAATETTVISAAPRSWFEDSQPAEGGVVRHAEVPGSTVEALADGAPIQQGELRNPNER